MSGVTPKVLIQTKYASNSQQTEYNVPGSTTTIIDKFTATNIDSGAQTVTVYLIPSGQSVGNAFKVIDAISIPANTALDITQLQNHILATGDIINAFASASSKVVIKASGREVVP
jgi:hypothetical protein